MLQENQHKVFNSLIFTKLPSVFPPCVASFPQSLYFSLLFVNCVEHISFNCVEGISFNCVQVFLCTAGGAGADKCPLLDTFSQGKIQNTTS